MALTKGTNSYVSLAEADAYFANRIDADAWTDADLLDKNKALITATAILDDQRWTGIVVSEDQPLAFPRSGSYFDPRLGIWQAFDENTPMRVQKATFEMAIHILTNEGLLDESGSVVNLNVADINLQTVRTPPKIPSMVSRLIKPLLVNAGSNAWWRAN